MNKEELIRTLAAHALTLSSCLKNLARRRISRQALRSCRCE